MLGVNYGPAGDPLADPRARASAARSRSMRSGDDYHDVIKKRLKALARWLVAERRRRREGVRRHRGRDGEAARREPPGSAGRASTPIWCRASSARGCSSARSSPRSSCRRTRPRRDHCGTCRACLDVCPTAAFPAPYRLDARRCISYLTIEHKGPIPRELRAADGQPHLWLRRLPGGVPVEQVRAGRPRGQARGARRAARRRGSPTWRGSTMRRSARCSPRSPVKRTGRDRFVRNVLIAIGNSGDPALAAEAEARLDDASPLVRGAAVWALSRLAGEGPSRRPGGGAPGGRARSGGRRRMGGGAGVTGVLAALSLQWD